MAIQAPQPFNAFLQGRKVYQDEQYANSRNALASMDVQNAPVEAQQKQQMNALAIQQGQNQQAQYSEQQMKESLQKTAAAALHIAQDPNPRALLQGQYRDFAATLTQAHPEIASYDDNDLKGFMTTLAGHAQAQLGQGPEKTQPFTLKPGEQRFGPDGKLVASVAAAPNFGAARLTETQRHNKAMEQKGSQPASADNVETAAKAISNYQQSPLGSMAMRSPYGQAVMARVMELNPDYQSNEYGARSKAYKDFASGKQGTQVASFNRSFAHLETLSKLSEAMGNGDLQALNKLKNSYATQTGKAGPANFDAAKKVVADEIVKAIVGTGGGVADREEASNTINRASSPAQLAGVIDTYKELIGGQLTSLQQQYEQSTGRKDFQRFLAPEVIKYADEHPLAGAQPQNQPAAGLSVGQSTQLHGFTVKRTK